MARYLAGSRSLTGNLEYHEALELEISRIVGKKFLLLNFGYQGIISVVDILVDKNDKILHDQLVHGSLIDRVRFHQGPKHSFCHNNLGHSERHLAAVSKINTGGILVLVDSVFSIRGGTTKVEEIIEP